MNFQKANLSGDENNGMAREIPPRTKSIAYDEIAGVLSGSVYTIVSHTSSEEIWMSSIFCSGRIYAEFSVWIDGNKVATKRSSPERNVSFEFSNAFFLDNGTTLEVKVIHHRSDQIGTFEAAVFGHVSQYALT